MSRKEALIVAVAKVLNDKIEHGKALPGMTEETMSKLVAMRDCYIAKANALPEEFFDGLKDVRAAMIALNSAK